MSKFRIDPPDPRGLSPYPGGWPDFSEVCSSFKYAGGMVRYDGPLAYCQATELCCQPNDPRFPQPGCGDDCEPKCRVYGPCCHVPSTGQPWNGYDDSGDSDLVVASATEGSEPSCDTYDPFLGTNCVRFSPEVPPSWVTPNEFGVSPYGSGDDAYDRLTLTPCISVGQRHAMKTFLGTLEKGIFEGSSEAMAGIVNQRTKESKRFFLTRVGEHLVRSYAVAGALAGALVAYRNALADSKREAEGFLSFVSPFPVPPGLPSNLS